MAKVLYYLYAKVQFSTMDTWQGNLFGMIVKNIQYNNRIWIVIHTGKLNGHVIFSDKHLTLQFYSDGIICAASWLNLGQVVWRDVVWIMKSDNEWWVIELNLTCVILKLPSLFAVWLFWCFHNKSHNMKALVILSHSWSPLLLQTCLYE